MQVYKALTIAGSDSGGGAGIQADLKTFQELEVFGMTAITAVTAQNTMGVQGVYPVPVEGIVEQIKSISDDLTPNAVKTGMLFNSEIIEAVSNLIEQNNWRKIIVDPVMIAKGGSPLLLEEAVETMKKKLLPLAYVITPNIPEAEHLTGLKITNLEDRKEAAYALHQMGVKNVVIKGGHEEGTNQLIDLLYDGDTFYDFATARIETKHTHGTGCTFAAAITAYLSRGEEISAAVENAQRYVHAAIKHSLQLGSGHGPTNHWGHRLEKKEGLLS